MKGHLSAEALMDVLDGVGVPAARAHVDACEACRARLREAEDALALAADAPVPEPSPLYWEALRRNVRRRVAEETRPHRAVGWLVPLAAAGALVVAVWMGHAPPSPPQPAPTLPSWTALPPVAEDPALDVLGDVVAAEADATVWDDGRGLGAFVADLSDEETVTLVEALRAAGRGAEL